MDTSTITNMTNPPTNYIHQPPDSLLQLLTNNRYGYEYHLRTITSEDNTREARIIFTQGIIRLFLYSNDRVIYKKDYPNRILDLVEHKAVDYSSLGLVPL